MSGIWGKCGLAAVGVGAAFLSAAQQTETGPVLSVTTRVVEVHVVVHDKAGKTVAGLTKEDFVLKDRGQPQKISGFSELTKQPGAAEPAGLPPGVYSNTALGDKARASHAVVVLLDQLNTRVTDQNFGQYKLKQFLGQAHPGDKIAIIELTPDARLRLLADFTSNSERLLQAAKAVQTRSSRLQDMSETDKTNRGEGDSGDISSIGAGVAGGADMDPLGVRKAGEFATEVRTEHTLRAIEMIGRSLASIPGRKSLVWLSSSFPFSIGYQAADIMHWRPLRLNFEERAAVAARVLTDANVAVYPVGIGGLEGVAMARTDESFTYYGNSDLGAGGTAVSDSTTQMNRAMDALAQATGGRAFHGRNDLDVAMGQALEDASHVYVLAYSPSHDEWNGRFRPIEVKVKRPGLHVQFRKGYYAWAAETDAQRESVLTDVLSSPLEATAIGLTASVMKQGTQWKLVLNADAHQFTLEPQAGGWQGQVTAVFVVEDAKGKPLATKAVNAPLKWTEQERRQKFDEGARFNRVLDDVPGAARVRVILRDVRSAHVGSITIPLSAS